MGVGIGGVVSEGGAPGGKAPPAAGPPDIIAIKSCSFAITNPQIEKSRENIFEVPSPSRETRQLASYARSY
jgi:hypothetical protein